MTTYATVTTQTAKLAEPFARAWIARLFGADALGEIDAALPLYTRGKNAGLPKGTLKWWRALDTGYAREVCAGVKPGTIRIELHTGNGFEDSTCFGLVILGRVQFDGLDLPLLRVTGANLKKAVAR